jgi:hypothetical protein
LGFPCPERLIRRLFVSAGSGFCESRLVLGTPGGSRLRKPGQHQTLAVSHAEDVACGTETPLCACCGQQWGGHPRTAFGMAWAAQHGAILPSNRRSFSGRVSQARKGASAMRLGMLFMALVVPGSDGAIHAETNDGIFRGKAPERGPTVWSGFVPEKHTEALSGGPVCL